MITDGIFISAALLLQQTFQARQMGHRDCPSIMVVAKYNDGSSSATFANSQDVSPK
jgi:hypothetical protein